MKLICSLALVCLILANVEAHKYRAGDCPRAEPVKDFDMQKFMGIWYAVQKTATSSECVIYNITNGDEPGLYKVQQISQNYLLGLVSLRHKYSYTGDLEVKDMSVPAKMTVRFPLNVVGTAKFTVFNTDYQNHAGIFTCQKLPIGHRQSATILSRTRPEDIDAPFVAEMHDQLASFGVDPETLRTIRQKSCPKLHEKVGLNINIDSNTLSTDNVADMVRKFHEKFAGVESVIGGARKIFNRFGKLEGESDEMFARMVKEGSDEDKEEDQEDIWLP